MNSSYSSRVSEMLGGGLFIWRQAYLSSYRLGSQLRKPLLAQASRGLFELELYLIGSGPQRYVAQVFTRVQLTRLIKRIKVGGQQPILLLEWQHPCDDGVKVIYHLLNFFLHEFHSARQVITMLNGCTAIHHCYLLPPRQFILRGAMGACLNSQP